jgi:hypothetical protein
MRHLSIGMMAAAALLLPLSASGNTDRVTQCALERDVLAGLESRYGETVVFRGRDSADATVMVTAAASGAWTLLIAPPGLDIACMAAHGSGGTLLPLPTLRRRDA